MKINKIYILGTSGSGKTYLANQLSRILKIKNYDLDDIYWIKKFTIKKEKRRDKLKKLLKGKKQWIIEGIYTDWAIDAVKKSDFIILIDTPFKTRAYRILKRYIKRKIKGNSESIKDCFNLIKYSSKYKKEHKNPESYQNHKSIIKRHNKKFIIIKNKRQINRFLNNLKSKK